VLKADLTPFSLTDAAGKVVVINSVPSLDTSVCAAQTRRFNQEATGLGEGVEVVVISMELPFAQKRFCSDVKITEVEPLSDHREASFGPEYGLLIKELRLLARAVLVVGMDGAQQLVPEVGQELDYEAELAEIRRLL
jgi:thiol peroxidase